MFAKNPLRAESAGQRVEIMPVFCLGLSGLGKFVPRVTWASTRHARSSPGCHIVGFQPATAAASRQRLQQAFRRIAKFSRQMRELHATERNSARTATLDVGLNGPGIGIAKLLETPGSRTDPRACSVIYG